MAPQHLCHKKFCAEKRRICSIIDGSGPGSSDLRDEREGKGGTELDGERQLTVGGLSLPETV